MTPPISGSKTKLLANWKIIKTLIYYVLTSSSLEIVSSLFSFRFEGELINTGRIIDCFFYVSFLLKGDLSSSGQGWKLLKQSRKDRVTSKYCTNSYTSTSKLRELNAKIILQLMYELIRDGQFPKTIPAEQKPPEKR